MDIYSVQVEFKNFKKIRGGMIKDQVTNKVATEEVGVTGKKKHVSKTRLSCYK